MKRPEFSNQKDILVITDYPIKVEVESEVAFSSVSHLNILKNLRKIAKVDPLEIATTYLSYDRPEKDNYEFAWDIKPIKDSLPGFKDIPEMGIALSPVFSRNIEGLEKQINLIKPKLIIVYGKWSFFLLSSKYTLNKTRGTFKDKKPLGGLETFRASQITFNSPLIDYKETCCLFPMYPATTIYRMPTKGAIISLDYRKIGEVYYKLIEETWKKSEPKTIISECSFTIIKYLYKLWLKLIKEPTIVSVDIETKANCIDTIGFAYKKDEAISIIFGTKENSSIFKENEETYILYFIRKILLHKNCKIVGQNYQYDSQFLNKFWLVNKPASLDTMINNHIIYNFMPKNLAFLASIYCSNYTYWKDLQDHSEEK